MLEIHLGINIDHIATLRNARGENDPSIVEMASEVIEGGANSLTMHLREDRRHILDADIFEIQKHVKVPLNLEMALTDEMLAIAEKLKPSAVCLVPEKRQEITTEGGIDLQYHYKHLQQAVPFLKKNDIEVYFFIEPQEKAIALSAELNADGVEIHTGSYAQTFLNRHHRAREWQRIVDASELCKRSNLIFHAGHGLNYQNIQPFLYLENLTEVNIGHAVIARALKIGLKTAVQEMKFLLER